MAKRKRLDTQSVIRNSMPVCDNLTETVIQVTESKARLIYRENRGHNRLEHALTAFGLFLSFITTLFTSEFKDVFGENSKYVIHAIFIILAGVSLVCTIYCIVMWAKEYKTTGEEAFINALKGQIEA